MNPLNESRRLGPIWQRWIWRSVGATVTSLLGVIFFGSMAAMAYWLSTDSSNFFTAQASASSLSAPTGPIGTANGGGAITVSWSLPAQQLTGANYQVIRTAPGSPTTVCTVVSTSTSCQDTGLVPGTLYSYSVTAVLSLWKSSTVSTSATTLLPTYSVTLASGPYTAGTSVSVVQIRALISGSADLTYSGIRTVVWSGLANSPSGTAPVYPSPSVSFVNGVASTVGTVTSYFAGSNTVTVSDSQSLSVTGSASFTTGFSTASKLSFVVSPSNSSTGIVIPTQPAVSVQDAFGNTITTDSSVATLSIAAGTPTVGGPGTLSGCSQSETLGIITFTGCVLTTTGTNYKLTAVDGALTLATSTSFNVAGAATQVVVLTQPTSSTTGVVLPIQPVVQIEDANGNVAVGDISTVAISITAGTPTSGGPGTLSGCSQSESFGVVTFSGCKITTPGSGYKLTFSDGLLTPTTSAAFNIAGAATKAVVTTSPAGATGGSVFATQPVVTIEDVSGNTVTTDSSTITLAITAGTPVSGGPGTLSGCSQSELLGVITFTGCKINTSGTSYKVTATDGALSSGTSGTFNVTVGPATQVVETTNPAGATGGTAFATQPIFKIEDAGGNVVTSDSSSVTLSITSGTPSLGGPGTLSGCSSGELLGVFTFAGCKINTTGTGYQLTATDGALTSASTSTFNVTVGPSALLIMSSSPNSTTGGTAFSSQPVVTVEDAGGNVVTSDSSTITLAITSGTPATGGPGTLSGCSQSETLGVVTFTGCKINTAGTGYQLTATDGSLTSAVSTTFNVSVGPATQVAVTTNPSGASGGSIFSTQPVVSVEDAGGNVVIIDSSTVTLAITAGTPATGGPGTLSGCAATETLGVFTFTGCQINTAGTGYRLTATDGSLSFGLSGLFNVVVGPATQIVLVTNPAGATGGLAFSTQPVMKIEDAGSNVVTTDSSTVTLAISSGTPATGGPGALTGCTPSEIQGVVTFSGCKINTAGTGYRLTATDGSLTSVTTNTLNVTVGPAALLAVTTNPVSSTGGVMFSTQPVVTVEDAGGNVVATDSSTVTLTIATGTPTSGGPGTLSGCAQSETLGVVTFTGCKINTAGTGYKLTASDGILSPANTTAFNVTVGPATQIVATANPAGATGGIAFTTQPVFKVEDAGGNVVTGDVSTASLSLTAGTPATGGPGTLSGCAQAEALGVITYSGCKINTSGNGYSLSVTDGALTPATTNTFNVTVGPASKLSVTTLPGASTSAVVFTVQPAITIQDAGGNTVTSAVNVVTLAINSGSGTLLCTTNPIAATAGVATFAGCKITLGTDGSFTLKATATGLTQATSGSFNVYGAATKAIFTVQPTASTGGVNITVQPAVSIEDAAGHVIPNATNIVTLAITSGTGTLTCTTNPVTAVAGVATFAGCQIALGTQGNFTLSATSSGLTPGTSAIFTEAGAATKLAFTTQPTASTGGVNITVQPIVKIEDSSGDVVTTSTASVTLAIASGTGTLACTTNPVTAVAGAANFAGCKITLGTQGNFTLSASSAGLTPTTSSVFTEAGAATKLIVTTQPTASTGGSNITVQPVIKVEDSSGDVVTTSTAPVTLAIATGTGTLSCTTNPLTSVAGAATFVGCKITLGTQGNFSLTATSSGLTSTTTSTFSVAGAATHLVFTTQPTASTGGANITVQPVIKVEDSIGDVVTTSTAPVTLAIATGTGTLTCTTNPLASVAGVATFVACKITLGTQGNFSLTATSSGLTSATSSVFTVAGTATQLVYSAQPSTSTGGTSFTIQPIVKVEDSTGDVVTTSVAPVTLAIATGTGTLTCTTNPLTSVAGVATFAACKITLGTQGSFTLTASSGALTSATTGSFTVAGVKIKTVFTQQPGASATGTTFAVQPVVAIEDSTGNIVTTAVTAVTLSLASGSGTLTCTTNPVTAVAGVAIFAGCKITLGTQGNFTLLAVTSGVTNATSTGFTVAGAPTKLVFGVQPGGGSIGTAWSTQPVVFIEDSSGDVVTNSVTSVTLSISAGTGTAGAVLTCTSNPLSAFAGVATFTGCAIDLAGTNYTVTATGSGVTAAISSSFNIT